MRNTYSMASSTRPKSLVDGHEQEKKTGAQEAQIYQSH